jgi:hypothetical protein
MANQGASQDALWREFKRAHGVSLPQSVRAFLAAQHAQALAEQQPRKQIMKEMLDTLANLRAHSLWPVDDERPLKLPRAAKRDGRWALWRDLHERRAELLNEDADERPWTPLRIGRQREAGTITFKFDHRLAATTVRSALKDELPRLRARGWMGARRSLSGFQLALVRYVCLESPLTASWRERTKGWRHSRFVAAHAKWGKPYRGKKATRHFKRDFHKAENALAGSRGALGVHYDPRVRARHLELGRSGVAAEPALTDDAASTQQRDIAWPRADPAKAEALRARFAAAAEIEALVARAQAGDAAAADEAVALCLPWRPAAIDELNARLGRMRYDAADDTDQHDDVE